MKENKPDPKRLRSFGLILGLLLAIFAWRYHHKGYAIAPWLFGIGLLSALTASMRPLWLAPVERNWMKVARVIARVNTFVILTLLYYLVITPLGLILRLTSGDPLSRAYGKEASYWKRRTSGEDLTSYERQF